MLKNVGIITQARMTSTRLPGKVLLKAAGKTMLEHHLDRLRSADLPIYVATTTNETDDPIVELLETLGYSYFRGSEDDVLERYYLTSQKYELDTVIRVTSDCPLIDGSLLRDGFEEWRQLKNEMVYYGITRTRSYPIGMDFEVFSAKRLAEAYQDGTEPREREHVTPYLYLRHPNVEVRQKVRHAPCGDLRLTLDTPADFDLLKRLIEEHGALDRNVDELIKLFEANPNLTRINAHVEHNWIEPRET